MCERKKYIKITDMFIKTFSSIQKSAFKQCYYEYSESNQGEELPNGLYNKMIHQSIN